MKQYNKIIDLDIQVPMKLDIDFYIDKETSYCRFCKKTKEETSFKNRSHVIPEFLGNGSLLIYSECDQCNLYFSKNYDNHLSIFTAFERSILGIKGKNGIPNFQHDSMKIKIIYKESIPQIHIDPESNFMTICEDKGEIYFKFNKNPFIPYSVYKSFIRLGFCFLPLNVCKNLESTREFIRSKNKTILGSEVNSVVIQYTVQNHFRRIRFCIFERVNEDKFNRPKFICTLVYNDKAYQYHIPNKEFDDNSKNLTMNIIPIFENVYDHLTKNFNKKDLEREYEEKMKYTFSGSDKNSKNKDFINALHKKTASN